ncbi:inactive protein kinase SELMODRAFT_444075-like isoform X2 [Olea europaea var. sylvestris]|uniref:inactive protein kinase SELMODRAFT_444075-like isoform X2 n=1 Tax=Olea europaea var. sylvestris TaxID=158386 RepID=UPI000C1D069D|nr:inactive protein kinase SELMODRAFT_444075-like isoform X2 [Olea europaea var. sylvestris]
MFPPKPQGIIHMPPCGVDATSRSVIVTVKAEKVISNTALSWAITHVARPGDCILLLAVFSDKMTAGRRFWGIPRLKGDCRSADRNKLLDRIGEISESCSQMVLQFHGQIQVGVQIKVVSARSGGSVAAEAKRNVANWVILDKKLKRELKNCMDELRCNIVIMKGSRPKILRLNLSCSNDLETPFYSAAASPLFDSEKLQSQRMKHSTPVSSPDDPSTSCTRNSGTNALISTDTGASIFVVFEQNPLYEGLNKGKSPPGRKNRLDPLRESIKSFTTVPGSRTERDKRIFWIPQNHIVAENSLEVGNCKDISSTAFSTVRTELDNFVQFNQDIIGGTKLNQNLDSYYEFNYGIREAVALGRTSSNPPPLCSLCQYKAPAFGKPPRQFHYRELEEATDGFSDKNFLAEGGFGLVHRGVLRNGLIIAVKRLKLAGSQRDDDFCTQVRVLSCAQHRNVVLLLGFCIEGKKRLLVYEYICNGSLDFHLHGERRMTLDWKSRLKIAIGTARGLRYLHEDCRVGCMIHQDMRPNNILLTHDFEPLVADFGLGRLHCEWDFCDSDQIVKTSGYLAPEYFSGGNMTEKVDVYAFGLVLLELITGERASDLLCCIDRQLLVNNFHPSAAIEPIQPIHMLAYKHQLLDSCLASFQTQSLPYEIQAMGYAASLCLRQNPELRPPMSKVLRTLERGSSVSALALDLNSIGSRSGHMEGLNSKRPLESNLRHSRRLSY